MENGLLARAILAFDVIIQDVLADLKDGIEPNSVAVEIMEMLCKQVPNMPEVHDKLEEYIINMADMGGRIKLLTMSVPVEDAQLDFVIGRQKERIAELDQEVKIVKLPVHKGSQSIN
jgi:hypothetical protein